MCSENTLIAQKQCTKVKSYATETKTHAIKSKSCLFAQGANTLKRSFEDDPEEELITFEKIKPGQRERARSRSHTQAKPTRKASYESSADVQRWLREQSYDVLQPDVGFHPTLLASKRDAPWILSSLEPFYKQHLITDVLHEAHSGKEATVYCCQAHPSTGVEYLAAKIYRPRMFRSLRNDAIYRYSRVQRDEQGQAEHGNSRRGSAATRKTEKGRAAQVASWIEYEYQTQRLLYAHGANVPRTFAQIGNAVLMEYIGDVGEPAPRLSDVVLEDGEAQPLFDCIMYNIELALKHGRIHGDLSGYNILYWNETVTLIDFAQAVDPYHNSDVFSLFLRDIKRICQYFAQYNVQYNANELAREIWSGHMGPIPELI
jgi:RIO kinase 1